MYETTIDPRTGALVAVAQPAAEVQATEEMQSRMPQGITVNANISDGTKKVALVIRDAAAVASLILAATGHSEFGNGIQALAGLAETALDGYENGAQVEITPESINGLLADPQPLASPSAEGSAPDITTPENAAQLGGIGAETHIAEESNVTTGSLK
jgi:hypothetical protein